MAIDKTVKMCRASARTDLARAVIASTKFTDSKEVISAFVVEVGREVEEKQILAYRANRNNRNNFNQNRGYRGRRGRGNYHNQNFQNSNNNKHNNNRGKGNNGYRNSGNRGGYNNYNNNGNGRNGQNDRNVRFTASGNGQGSVQNNQVLDNEQQI